MFFLIDFEWFPSENVVEITSCVYTKIIFILDLVNSGRIFTSPLQEIRMQSIVFIFAWRIMSLFFKFLNQCVSPRGSQRTKEIRLSSVYDQQEFDVHISDKSYNHLARNI